MQEIAISYKPGYNPKFYAQAIENQKRREQERARAEAEREKQEALRRHQEDIEKRHARALAAAYKALEESDGELDIPQFDPASKPMARDIIKQVALEYGVKASEITGARTHRYLIEPRHEAMARVAVARPDMSLPVIGKLFNRDHSTVVSALRKRGVVRQAAR